MYHIYVWKEWTVTHVDYRVGTCTCNEFRMMSYMYMYMYIVHVQVGILVLIISHVFIWQVFHSISPYIIFNIIFNPLSSNFFPVCVFDQYLYKYMYMYISDMYVYPFVLCHIENSCYKKGTPFGNIEFILPVLEPLIYLWSYPWFH